MYGFRRRVKWDRSILVLNQISSAAVTIQQNVLSEQQRLATDFESRMERSHRTTKVVLICVCLAIALLIIALTFLTLVPLVALTRFLKDLACPEPRLPPLGKSRWFWLAETRAAWWALAALAGRIQTIQATQQQAARSAEFQG